MAESDLAEQFASLVATMSEHPIASAFAGLLLLLMWGMRKDGLFSRYLSYREEKARLDTAREIRRMELLEMLSDRGQLSLPGVIREEDRDQQ